MLRGSRDPVDSAEQREQLGGLGVRGGDGTVLQDRAAWSRTSSA